MKDYYYVTNCVASTYEDVREAIDHEVQVTRRTFVSHTDDQDRKELEKELGYDHYFPMSRDWHVGYYRGTFMGVPAYWFRWSGIEHFFTLHGRIRERG